MRRSKKTRNWPLRIAALLLCLTLWSAAATGGLYARYSTTATGGDSARVALFGHDETITLLGDTEVQLVPGDTRSFPLSVRNFTTDRTSEVGQKYSIEVVTAGNLPLTFTLTKDGKTVTPIEGTAATTHTYETDDMVFTAGTERTDNYTLTVSWPESRKEAGLADLPDYIQINLRVEQMD